MLSNGKIKNISTKIKYIKSKESYYLISQYVLFYHLRTGELIENRIETYMYIIGQKITSEGFEGIKCFSLMVNELKSH